MSARSPSRLAPRRWPWLGSCLIACTLGFGEISHAAAPLAEAEVKAAFLFNFTLFTTWPQLDRELRLCVMGDDHWMQLLASYRGRVVQGATVRVPQVATIQEAQQCELLFVDASEVTRFERWSPSLKNVPVLTVCEINGSRRELPCSIGLAHDQNRVSFDVNQTVSREAGLRLSSKLLRLARTVLP